MLYIFLQQISHSTNTLCAWKFHRAKIIMCIAVSLFVRSKSVSQSYDETSCIMWPSEQSQTQMKKKNILRLFTKYLVQNMYDEYFKHNQPKYLWLLGWCKQVKLAKFMQKVYKKATNVLFEIFPATCQQMLVKYTYDMLS